MSICVRSVDRVGVTTSNRQRASMRLITLGLLISLAFCRTRERRATSDQSNLWPAHSSVGACPAITIDRQAWTRVRLKDTSVTLQLPPGYYELEKEPVQQWALPEGSSMAYELHARDSLWFERAISRLPTGSKWCRIAGSTDSLLAYISRSRNGFKEGFFLEAIVPISSKGVVKLIGYAKDSVKFQVPLAIAQSLEVAGRH